MKNLIKVVLFTAGLVTAGHTMAAGGGNMRHANIDSHDQASLQDGARTYMNYCAGCHSLKYMRFNRLATDLGLSDEEVEKNFMFAGGKIQDFITNSMPAKDAAKWFGKVPPDLSLVGRSRGADWLFTYLTGFYVDSDRPVGVNNVAFKDVGMPHVLAGLQGKQTKDKDGVLHVVEGSGSMSTAEYDKTVRNLVNFLSYTGEPIKNYRSSLGWYVLAFLLLMFVITYLLKKEYWKDIH